jgi:hypothetical protein
VTLADAINLSLPKHFWDGADGSLIGSVLAFAAAVLENRRTGQDPALVDRDGAALDVNEFG